MSDGAIGEAMAMDQFTFESVVREQLLDRREKLEEAIGLSGDFEFANLLGEVDTALAKLDKGTYGQCEACDGQIESERLLADPLVRVCLSELSNAERAALENDLELAAAIQNGLLPKSVKGNGAWKADFVYEPHGIVSGDYCDVILQEDELYFVLGDVSGKGMAASLLMSSLHAMFHTLIPLRLSLGEIMSRANHLLAENSPANTYATLIAGRANRGGEIEIVNAGHLPPVVIKNGMKGEFDVSGLPLGMFADVYFPVGQIHLSKGDSIVLFTDGVTESTNGDGTEFGTCRLFESLNGASEPSELIRASLDSLTSFRGRSERRDDLTMLALTFSGSPV
jgi:sigma-B regulation protein RsbU (phosphoserine phosphatase)